MSNPNNLSDESLGNPGTLFEREVMLTPGQPLELPPDQFIAGTDEIQAKLGVGFSGSLRAIVECNPGDEHQTEAFYIFDRGPNSQAEAVVNVAADKTVIRVGSEDRYIVMTQRAVDDMQDFSANNYSMKYRVGWQGFPGDTQLTIGRNEETEKMFRTGTEINGTISHRHFDLALGNDGKIGITDLGSTNGTAVIK